MSLFGAKPATSTASLFGAQPAKPTTSLFGSTTQSSTAGTLFGSTAPTSTTGGLFGFTAPTASSGGLFGTTTTTSAAPTGGLFGTAPTASTGGLFGAPKPATGGLFGTSTSAAPAFSFGGAKPTTTTAGGLFGAAPAAQQPAAAAPTAPAQISGQANLAALMQAVTGAQIYGDERDNAITQMNQLLTMCGVNDAKLYYHSQAPPATATDVLPFMRFNAIVYNSCQTTTDADGLVTLRLGKTVNEIAGQKQAVIDMFYKMLGAKPQLKVNVDSIEPVANDDTQCELTIYVEESSSMSVADKWRIAASQLYAFLAQSNIATQLQSQLTVKEVYARVKWTDEQHDKYVQIAPAGIDPSVWRAACMNNPSPSTLIPVVLRGYKQLAARHAQQTRETEEHRQYLKVLTKRVSDLHTRAQSTSQRASKLRRVNDQLAHRLVRVMAAQWTSKRHGTAIDAQEEQLAVRVDNLYERMNAAAQLKITEYLHHASRDLDRLVEQLQADRHTVAQGVQCMNNARMGTSHSYSFARK